MSTYLLTWKPDEWEYDLLQQRIERFESGDKIHRWSSGRTKRIATGSRVFLTKQGAGQKGLFGSGYVVSEPVEEPHFNEEKRSKGKTSLFVDVEFDRLYDPLTEIKIDRSELMALDPNVWDSQGSGKSVPDDVAAEVEVLWAERTGGVELPYPDEIEIDSKLKEGAVKKVLVNRYERNPEARERCIKRWGRNCVVCNFHFELFYGPLGKRYIHVHHLKPLQEIGEEYEVDPENDLRPVCPNCHAMLHREKPAISIEELRSKISAYGHR